MKIIEQSHEILSLPEQGLQLLEKAGRTCYKSEDKITRDSAEKFVDMLVRRGHHAMIEFGDIVVKLITNRGVTHELVRHKHTCVA
jgi:thymidylate synthase (FAD)